MYRASTRGVYLRKTSVLVVGLLPFDSGKTTIAKNLARALAREGIDVGVSKPIAGHSLWLQPLSYLYSMYTERLVGEDVIELRNSCRSGDPLEEVNPVDIATAPLDPEYYGRLDYYVHEVSVSSTYRIGLLTRVSRCDSDSPTSRHYIVRENYMRLSRSLRDYIDELIRHLRPGPEEISYRELLDTLREVSPATDNCTKRLYERHRVLVIESFNNAAAPNMYSLNSDMVLAVAPGRLYLYDGERYREAFETIVSTGITGLRALENWPTTLDIVRYIRHTETMEIPPVVRRREFEEFIERLGRLVVS